jgi:molybdopterin-guanine dinucleotide biosynthesis protein A
MMDDVTGVILAGGKSSRMGKNKARLPLHGKPLIEHVAQRLSKIFKCVLISIRAEENYPDLKFPKILDLYPDHGPLGGILSVLESGESKIFCAGCDMPFVNERLIEHLCSISADNDAVIPVWENRMQVLHAVYSASIRTILKEAITSKQLRLMDSLKSCRVRYLSEDEVRQFDSSGLSFRNVNTPEDYEQLLKVEPKTESG